MTVKYDPNHYELHDLQHKVDQSIRKLGGYWRPLSTLARVLEEIGEAAEILQPLLSEQTENQTVECVINEQDLGEELADLFIISTCLANQYCADLREEYEKVGANDDLFVQQKQREQTVHIAPLTEKRRNAVRFLFVGLISQGSQVARIVNHYEGDKKKKKNERLPSVAEEISKFQGTIIQLANTMQLPLLAHVDQVLHRNLQRDKGRFEITRDPITEPARMKMQTKLKSEQIKGKIWGWTERTEQNREQNEHEFRHILSRFVKCAEAEGLAGIAVELRAKELAADSSRKKELTQRLLSGIMQHVPQGTCASLTTGNSASVSKWVYEGHPFQVSTFHFADEPHSLFILLQPSYSLDRYGDLMLDMQFS